MARWAAALIPVLMLSACGGESTTEPPPPPPDTEPPSIFVVFPTGGEIDRDGDGLLDVELTWKDDKDSVDVGAVTVRSLEGVNGPADAATNLLEVWTVTRHDGSGLEVHETVENLLHPGTVRLEITVPDTAGNVLVDTLAFAVPVAAFHKTLQPGVGGLVTGITVCPDRSMAFAGVGRSMAAIDLEGMELVAAQTGAGDEVIRTLCVAGDPIVYASSYSWIWRWDSTTQSWDGYMPATWPCAGLVQSRANPDLLYEAETFSGDVGIIHRVTGARLGTIGLPQSISSDEFVDDLEVLESDARIYVPRQDEGGLIVAEPATGIIIDRLDVDDSSASPGRVYDLALSPDDSRLYVGVARGTPVGVWEIDTATDEVLRTFETLGWTPIDLSVSPDGTRLFVVTQDAGVQSWNYILDLQHWQILAQFPRPRPEGEARYDLAVVWHPNGKLILAARNGDIDVYLSRE
jgi:DNA-binding beta-propeller fold protein YncE